MNILNELLNKQQQQKNLPVNLTIGCCILALWFLSSHRDKCPQKTIDRCSYSNIATMEFNSRTYFGCVWFWFYFVTIKKQVLLLTHPPALTSNKHSGRNHIQREVPICLPKGEKAKCLHTMLPHNFNGGTTLGIQASFTRSWLLAVWPQYKLLCWNCCLSITSYLGAWMCVGIVMFSTSFP